jgi:hypothetical protein
MYILLIIFQAVVGKHDWKKFKQVYGRTNWDVTQSLTPDADIEKEKEEKVFNDGECLYIMQSCSICIYYC